MSEPTKLTPEQVADFERRAAAGERPVLEWCHWPTHGDKEISVLSFLHDSAIRIYWPSAKRGRVSDQFYMCFGVHDGDNAAFASAYFACLEAAQLAAEHLLAEATRALHKHITKEQWDHAFYDECPACGKVMCPEGEPLHFHHDGCPQCCGSSIESERDALRARCAELKAKVGHQRERIVYLEGATNHATGTPLSKAQASVAALESALSQERADAARTAWLLKNAAHGGYLRWDDEVEMWKGEVYVGRVSDRIPFGPEDAPWTDEARAVVDAAMARNESKPPSPESKGGDA